MTSKPLFIKVEESMVILGPIFQVGCLSASLAVIWANFSIGVFKNGPPEAVKTIFLIVLGSSPLRHWTIALCSESMGKTLTPAALTSCIKRSPATTKTSFVAKARSFLDLTASRVGTRQREPGIATTTILAVGSVATL